MSESKTHKPTIYNTSMKKNSATPAPVSFPEFKVERLTVADSLADRVCEALVQLISGEDFPPGSRLPSEMKMASRFGVSRTVIREAVSRLKSEGLVESRQGSGVFVREGNMDAPFRIDPNILDSIQSVLQVVELRKVLEGEIAALAAKRRSKTQLAAIRAALKQIETEVRAGSNGVDADIAFHRSIAEATGNPHFLALIQFLFNFLRSATQTTRGIEATRATLTQQVKDEHRAIVEAIARQDAEAARGAARLHMDRASRRLGSADIKQLLDASASVAAAPAMS
jgi:GntR family transcriptional regulator, transcriptional repressor for pyruvate dehydrogenase complex